MYFRPLGRGCSSCRKIAYSSSCCKIAYASSCCKIAYTSSCCQTNRTWASIVVCASSCCHKDRFQDGAYLGSDCQTDRTHASTDRVARLGWIQSWTASSGATDDILP